MTEKKTLRNIVSENWDSIAKNLNLDIENKPENMLLMLSHLRPLLDSAAAAFPRPSVGVYSSVDDIYIEDLLIMEKMGFVDCTSYKNTAIGLTAKGADLIDCYHKSRNPNYTTNSQLIDEIIKLSDHLYD